MNEVNTADTCTDRFEFEAIGTSWSIELYSAITSDQATELHTIILQRIEDFDKAYSRFRADSLVTAMSQSAGSYQLPADAPPLLDLYRELYDLTGAKVTPLIGQTIADAGYDAEYSLTPKPLRTPAAWDDVLTINGREVSLSQPALLDFGAAGKGYLVDIIGQVLVEHGQPNFCIDASGDLLYHNQTHRLKIGLEHPADPTQVIGIAEIADQALCGSATNRRRWAGYHHIIDPSKLESPKHLAAVWVVADTALVADGLTTALFFTDAQSLLKQYNFEYACVYADKSLQYSTGFPGEFFS